MICVARPVSNLQLPTPQMRILKSTHSTGPVLLGFDTVDTITTTPWGNLPRHRDEEQVRLDVDRSFVYYPNGKFS